MEQKSELPYSLAVPPSGKYVDSSFYTTFVSAGMFYANSMNRFRLLENNTFDNIWVVDRKSAMQMSVGSEREWDYGLLIFVKNFLGRL